MDQLLNDGRNLEAIKLGTSMIDRMRLEKDDQALVLTYLSKACIELGLFGQAAKFIKSAETILSQFVQRYDAILFREKADLFHAAGEYDIAAKAAAKACRINTYTIRAEYCHSIQALAFLRMGNIRDAEGIVMNSVKAAPKKPGKHPFYAPRILYSACLVESHVGNSATAEAFCHRGLEIAAHSKRETRDSSLGYLALAEAHLQAGELPQSREAALKSTDVTARLFGTQHQDMVNALDLLARISLREGDTAAARARVAEAVKIATALFGEGSPGAAIPARTLHEIETRDPGGPRFRNPVP